MKIALHSASTPQLMLVEMLEVATQYGFEGLDIRSGLDHCHGIELTASLSERQQFRQLAKQAGVAFACLSISCRYADEQQVREQIRQTSAYLELAHDIGVPHVRVFAGRIPAESSLEQAKRNVVQALKTLGPIARSLGVYLLIETHDDWSDPFIVADLLQEIDDPNIGVVWDILHTFHDSGAEPEDVYGALFRWIRHVHIHDGVKKIQSTRPHPAYVPIGRGDIDHLRVVKALLQGGYGHYITGEWYDWEPADIHLPRELAALRAVLSEAGGGLL